MRGRKYIGALLILGLCVQVRAQLISVQPVLSADSIMIGDQLNYTIHVEADEKVDFIMPRLQDSLGSHLEILALAATDTLQEEGRLLVDHSYLVTAFEGGMHLIPAPRVRYAFGDIEDTAVGMPLMIAVHEPEVDTSQAIKAIKPPINTPVSFSEALPWAGLGLGVLLVAVLAYYLIKKYVKRRGGETGLPAKPLEPAHILAFRELDRLKDEKIWERGAVKAYYSQLTEITRRYIERQYGIPAMESTSEEILKAFRRSNTGDVILDDMLAELLQLADLVKFAKEDPLPVDNQTNLNNAYIFVQKTYPLFFRDEEDTKESEEKKEAEDKKEEEGNNG